METSNNVNDIKKDLNIVSSEDLTNLNLSSSSSSSSSSSITYIKHVKFADESQTNVNANANANANADYSDPDTLMQDTESSNNKWTKDARIYEYGSAANPEMKPIPVLVHPATLHESGNTRVIPFDISKQLDIRGGGRETEISNITNTDVDTEIACTSPNLLASFIRINVGDGIATQVPNATSQAFYVIRGSGTTRIKQDGDDDGDDDGDGDNNNDDDGNEKNTISWSTGDMFCVPANPHEMIHICKSAASHGGAALYWIHDEPLLNYLGVTPNIQKFEPTLYKRQQMLAHVQEIQHETGNCHRAGGGITNLPSTRPKNRLGVLLGNAKCDQTKTMTHVLWSLLNSIPADTVQRPHRHNSVALDLCISAEKDKVYTLMGKEIDSEGFIVDPIRCDWVPGSVFITPPGWWHSHHNESSDIAWVLPVQDAGLYTHQRTLDIRFVDDELKLHKSGRIRGSAFDITNKAYTEMVQIGATIPSQNERGMQNRDTAAAAAAAGMKRVFSAECLLSSKRLRCTQIGANPDLMRKMNNRITSLEGHVESIFD